MFTPDDFKVVAVICITVVACKALTAWQNSFEGTPEENPVKEILRPVPAECETAFQKFLGEKTCEMYPKEKGGVVLPDRK